MLDFHKDTSKTTVTVEDAKLRAKTEAYLLETVVQKLSDLYIARYGEQILAMIDIEELKQVVEVQVLKQLQNESIKSGVRDD